MESLAACSVAAAGDGRFFPRLPSPSTALPRRSIPCRRSRPLRVSAAARDGPELDKWDQMELKFGRLLGEDPNLTLAKILARKEDPDASYLAVEKAFRKSKGYADDTGAPPLSSLNRPRPPPPKLNPLRTDPNLNLSRPVMKKGMNAATPTGGNINLSRPAMRKGMVAATRPEAKPTSTQPQHSQLQGDVEDEVASNIALRKPSIAQDDDEELSKKSKLKIRPNLVLKMRTGSIEDYNDVALRKKPEVIQIPIEETVEDTNLIVGTGDAATDITGEHSVNNIDLVPKPSKLDAVDSEHSVNNIDFVPEPSKPDVVELELQPPKRMNVEPDKVKDSTTYMSQLSEDDKDGPADESSLLQKPPRLDSSSKKEVSPSTVVETGTLNDEDHKSAADVGQLISTEQKEREDNDWRRADHLLHTGERDEVELISCSGRGFVVSFGSLIGFLPYRNLGAKWKFLAFESWLRKKGLDPSTYRQNLTIMTNYDVQNKSPLPDLINKGQEIGQTDEQTLPPTMKFEELLKAYEQEKSKFLSSFVGQKTRVSVVQADRSSRKLLFSGRPKEKEELVEKKRSVMARLSVGDVVRCCIKKITYFGIFVEVEEVPALIHQSEVSWDAALDPSSFYKIGQTVEAKVHQLDFALERISLSLREITPDPLMEALESVVGDHTSLGGKLEAAQADVEWADVESLIKELQQIDGVHSVSKGRFFLSPGLAPTFQVYMASVFENQYKLLARFENKVQEVLVQASLDKEQMKATILACTNRVQ